MNNYGHKVRVTVGSQCCFFRSQFECRWARWLEMLRAAGQIDSWEYEPRTFVFPGVTRGVVQYTPDFRIVENGVAIWHECKGRLTGRDNTKFRRMAQHYPDVRIVLVMQRVPRRENGTLRIARKYVAVIDGGVVLRRAGL